MAYLVDSILINYDKYITLLSSNLANITNDGIIDLMKMEGYCKDSKFTFLDYQRLNNRIVNIDINSTQNLKENIVIFVVKI